MPNQHPDDLHEANMSRPPASSYQARVVAQSSDALLVHDQDVLIEAPTGAGKTRMLSDLAAEIVEKRPDAKVLIVTHRRNLLRQMAGDETKEDLKERLGEVAYWSGMSTGTIAEKKLGGINQNPDIVVGMVETAANLEDLEQYTDIIVDETHHFSEESATRDDAGSYARLLERMPNARLVGTTATTFRGDEGKLHPRLEDAVRFVVGIEETQDEGRTVPIKTHVTKARLENGMTPTELFKAGQEGKLDCSVSKSMSTAKGDAYYETCLDEWEKITKGKPTIIFADDVDEIKLITKKMKERFGPNSCAAIYGELNDHENDKAMSDYAEGKVSALVSCQMIGEGTDIPETYCVMSFNSSLLRGEMTQNCGRAARYAAGKEHGIHLDCGTGSARNGLIEDQHQIQTVRALAFSGNTKSAAVALARASASTNEDGWSITPGEMQTIFFKREKGNKFQAYVIDKFALTEEGKRVAKPKDAGHTFRNLTDRDGLTVMSLKSMSALIGEHVQTETAFIAKKGGLDSEEYKSYASNELKSWSEKLGSVSSEVPVNSASQLREARVRSAVRNEINSQARLQAVVKNLDSSENKKVSVKEAIRLGSCALDEISSMKTTPFGMRKGIQEMSLRLATALKGKKTDKDIAMLARSAVPMLTVASNMGLSKSASKTAKTLSTTIENNNAKMMAPKTDIRT